MPLLLSTAWILGLSALAWWVLMPAWSPRKRRSRLRDLLLEAGLPHVGPGRVVALSGVIGGFACLAMAAVSASLVLGVTCGLIASGLPLAWIRHLRRRRNDRIEGSSCNPHQPSRERSENSLRPRRNPMLVLKLEFKILVSIVDDHLSDQLKEEPGGYQLRIVNMDDPCAAPHCSPGHPGHGRKKAA